MVIDIDAVNLDPQHILSWVNGPRPSSFLSYADARELSLTLDQYREISKLYDDRELKKSGINNDLLKAALNALNCHTINTCTSEPTGIWVPFLISIIFIHQDAESMCNLKVIGRGNCDTYTDEGDHVVGGYGNVVKLRLPTPVAVKFLRITRKGQARTCLVSFCPENSGKQMLIHPSVG